jgi:hypothetical protein
MLSTINGFDLLLVIVIVLLIFKVMRLNDECNSYVRQIVEMSWDLQKVAKKAKDLEPPF